MTLALWEFFWDPWPSVVTGPLVGSYRDTFFVDAEPLLAIDADEFPNLFAVDAEPLLEIAVEPAFDIEPEYAFTVGS